MTTIARRVSAALYDPFFWLTERAGLAARRRTLVRRATGRVLEIGAGTGLNVRHYAEDVELVLSEPEGAMADRLHARVAGLGRTATVVLAPAEALPFADGEFDTVVSTLVLCTVPDQALALREIHRVLKPGGKLLFMEHVRSDSLRWARWQDRLNRPWRAFRRLQLQSRDARRAGREPARARRGRAREHARDGAADPAAGGRQRVGLISRRPGGRASSGARAPTRARASPSRCPRRAAR